MRHPNRGKINIVYAMAANPCIMKKRAAGII